MNRFNNKDEIMNNEHHSKQLANGFIAFFSIAIGLLSYSAIDNGLILEGVFGLFLIISLFVITMVINSN